MHGYVYRAFNKDGVLLYIGSTGDLGRRLHQHELATRWWSADVTFTSTRFDTLEAARRAELEAIAAECPRWNIRGRSPLHPDGPATDYVDVLALYPDDCRWSTGRSPFVAVTSARRRRNRAA
jgi:hypothetical protein